MQYPTWKITEKQKGGRGMARVVKHLPHKSEAWVQAPEPFLKSNRVSKHMKQNW
jgi:hypothetical protein